MVDVDKNWNLHQAFFQLNETEKRFFNFILFSSTLILETLVFYFAESQIISVQLSSVQINEIAN